MIFRLHCYNLNNSKKTFSDVTIYDFDQGFTDNLNFWTISCIRFGTRVLMKQSCTRTNTFSDRCSFLLGHPFSPGLEHPSHVRRMPGDTSPASESWFWFQRRSKLLHESWNTGRNRTRSEMETSFTFFFWFFWSRQSRLCQLVINSEKNRTFHKISSDLNTYSDTLTAKMREFSQKTLIWPVPGTLLLH